MTRPYILTQELAIYTTGEPQSPTYLSAVHLINTKKNMQNASAYTEIGYLP
jgi:hypothetical protein